MSKSVKKKIVRWKKAKAKKLELKPIEHYIKNPDLWYSREITKAGEKIRLKLLVKPTHTKEEGELFKKLQSVHRLDL